jgi:hypothetical protein
LSASPLLPPSVPKSPTPRARLRVGDVACSNGLDNGADDDDAVFAAGTSTRLRTVAAPPPQPRPRAGTASGGAPRAGTEMATTVRRSSTSRIGQLRRMGSPLNT